jgi:hypothetical protein
MLSSQTSAVSSFNHCVTEFFTSSSHFEDSATQKKKKSPSMVGTSENHLGTSLNNMLDAQKF